MRAIESPFDFYLRSAKPHADFFPWYAPAISLPVYGVIVCHLAGCPHAQNFFQVVFPF